MSVYMTEAEQIAMLKGWWQRYHNLLLIIITSILLAFSSVKYWNMHQAKVIQQASVAYEKMMFALAKNDVQHLYSYADQLISARKNTVYADAARLTLAKLAIRKRKYAVARDYLTYVALHSKVASLSDQSYIRLARVYLEEKTFDLALKQLVQIKDPVYTPLINQIRGDIFAAKGNKEKAREYYHLALNEFRSNGITNMFLEMTMNDYE